MFIAEIIKNRHCKSVQLPIHNDGFGLVGENTDDVIVKKITSEQSGFCCDVVGASLMDLIVKAKSKPSGAGSIWKGGARERADDVILKK